MVSRVGQIYMFFISDKPNLQGPPTQYYQPPHMQSGAPTYGGYPQQQYPGFFPNLKPKNQFIFDINAPIRLFVITTGINNILLNTLAVL